MKFENCKIRIQDNVDRDLVFLLIKDLTSLPLLSHTFSGGYIRILDDHVNYNTTPSYIADRNQPNDPWLTAKEFVAKYSDKIPDCRIWINNPEEAECIIGSLRDRGIEFGNIPKHFERFGYISIRNNEYDGRGILDNQYKTKEDLRELNKNFNKTGLEYEASEFIALYSPIKKENKETPEMTLQEAYLKMQANCGIEVGDKVRVLRMPQSYENGWSEVSPNRSLVEDIGIVKTINNHGIQVFTWYLPFFVLELVEKSKPKIMVGDHEVEFDDVNKRIKVGCTRVDYETCRKIAERINS